MVQKTKHRSNKIVISWSFIIIVISFVLSVIGLYFIFEASSVSGFRSTGDPFYYVTLQSLWFVLGIGCMLFFSVFDYHKLYYLSFPALLITILLLLVVLIPGIGDSVSGARRWLSIGTINIQPSEIAKMSVLLYLCSWFLHKERKRFLSFLMLLIFVIALIMFQPDMGTAIILYSIFIISYFLAGYDLHYLLFLIPMSFVFGLIAIKISPYRFNRLLAFFNPDLDPLGLTYHIKQVLISFSRGGLFGVGLGASRQKYQYLPEAHTDSILAIIGEEIGFIGTSGIIILLFVLITASFIVAIRSKDKFGRLLAGSICSVLAMQSIVNIGSMIRLFPMTGIPLPFISYGGSSLLVFFSLIGILLNISRFSRT